MVSSPKRVSMDEDATAQQKQQQSKSYIESTGQSQYYQKDLDYSLVQAPVLTNQATYTQFQTAPVYSESEGFYVPVTTPAPTAAPTRTPNYTASLNSPNTGFVTSDITSSTTQTTSTIAGDGETDITDLKTQPKTVPAATSTPVPCSAQPSGSTSIVNSGSSVTYTYSFSDASQINAVNFVAKAGIKYSMNGQTSASGQGLNLSLSPAQTTVQFTVLPDQACTPYTVSFSFTSACGANFSTFVGKGSASSYGAVCN